MESTAKRIKMTMEHVEGVNIGSRIREFRKRCGLTQEELANMLGYKSRSSINKIELGINDISQSKVIAFAKVLKTTSASLMGLKDDSEQLPEKEDCEIGHDLDRIMDKIENNSSGPLYYNGELIDDESLELLRKSLELGLSQLNKGNKLKFGRNKKTLNST